MTQYLPPNLLALFAPRDPIPYLPPPCKQPFEKTRTGYLGLSAFMTDFEDPKDTPAPTRSETREERVERKKKERAEQVAYKLEQDLAVWDPANNKDISTDPFKTLFVARICYDTSDNKLRREFESYGAIKTLKTLKSNEDKPRGYAFIEYEHERDMHYAYKHADGKKIDGKRVLVDIERGRTVKGWRPRRLGGGMGGTRRGHPDICSRYSGRESDRGGRSRSRSRGRRSRSRDRKRRRSRERGGRRSRSRDRDQGKRRRSRSPRRRGDRRRSRSPRGGAVKRERDNGGYGEHSDMPKLERREKEEPSSAGYVKREQDSQGYNGGV